MSFLKKTGATKSLLKIGSSKTLQLLGRVLGNLFISVKLLFKVKLANKRGFAVVDVAVVVAAYQWHAVVDGVVDVVVASVVAALDVVKSLFLVALLLLLLLLFFQPFRCPPPRCSKCREGKGDLVRSLRPSQAIYEKQTRMHFRIKVAPLRKNYKELILK